MEITVQDADDVSLEGGTGSVGGDEAVRAAWTVICPRLSSDSGSLKPAVTDVLAGMSANAQTTVLPVPVQPGESPVAEAPAGGVSR